jgi:hypothetical protein
MSGSFNLDLATILRPFISKCGNHVLTWGQTMFTQKWDWRVIVMRTTTGVHRSHYHEERYLKKHWNCIEAGVSKASSKAGETSMKCFVSHWCEARWNIGGGCQPIDQNIAKMRVNLKPVVAKDFHAPYCVNEWEAQRVASLSSKGRHCMHRTMFLQLSHVLQHHLTILVSSSKRRRYRLTVEYGVPS